jgi:hypothetical protein
MRSCGSGYRRLDRVRAERAEEWSVGSVDVGTIVEGDNLVE